MIGAQRLTCSGVAARMNVLGFMILEAYYAYPFQRPEKGPHFGFQVADIDSIGPLSGIRRMRRVWHGRQTPRTKRGAPFAARGRLWEKSGAGGRHGPYVGTRARPREECYRSARASPEEPEDFTKS